MKKSILRLFCLGFSALLGLTLFAGRLPATVRAAATTYQLTTLLTEGKIKALGRTKVNAANTGITADWSANGFEINVNAAGGAFSVGYSSNLNGAYSAILVDGVQVWRGLTTGIGTATVQLSAGKHTVTVLRENGHSSSATAYLYFTTVAFDGSIEAAPANKDLYIEVIGDSLACGSGSAEGVSYYPGVQWGDADHSGQASFGWQLSKLLDSDVSIVSRGGIGLLGDSDGAMEDVDNNATSLGVYPYASGHNTDEGAYSFARKPDLVIIELGANDGLKFSNPEKTATWNAQMESLIALVRKHNGDDVKILMLSHSAVAYSQMLKFADADENIYSCHFSQHGNGSAALARQIEGHPSAKDELEIAKALYKSIQDWDILSAPAQAESTYTDLVYYVSENGSDANDGKTLATAKASLYAAVEQADKDNATSHKLPAGTRIVVKVEGTVPNRVDANGNVTTNDILSYGQIITETGTALKDHKHIPILITTNDTAETNAVIQISTAATSNASATLRLVNDFYLKDITIQSLTNEKGYCAHTFYASGCSATFDNVLLTTDGKAGTVDGEDNTRWVVSASHATNGNLKPTKTEWLPMTGTVTFKNGDYTNLNYAAAVSNDTLTDGTVELPQIHCKLIIEDGAKMGTVYGAYGALAVDSVTVELLGGSVEKYYATGSGTSSAKLTYNTDITTTYGGCDLAQGQRLKGTGDYITLTGNVTNRFVGGVTKSTGALNGFCGTGNYVTLTGNVTNDFEKGQFIGELYAGVGSQSTVNGNVTNNISGGEIRVDPVGAKGEQGVYLAGFNTVNISGDVTNNISGGEVNLVFNANVDSGIYLGMRNGTISGDLTNNISAGNLYVAQYASEIVASGIFFGSYSGNVLGCFRNNISGGIFSLNNGSSLSLGNRTIHNRFGSIETVIGIKDSTSGPRFYGNVGIGGSRAFVGDTVLSTPSASKPIPTGWTTINGTTRPDPQYVSDAVIVKTTIYSGYFSGTFMAGPTATNSYTSNYYSYILGSMQTDVYGGKFAGTFYGTGATDVLGHATTNIYGGSFASIYGANNAYVYDGVELNIHGLTELITAVDSVTPTRDYRIYAGGNTAKVFTQTEGRDAVKLTIEPQGDKDLILRMPIYSGFKGAGAVLNGGTTNISIKGGIYPNGFQVDGKTLSEALAEGCSAVNYISGEALTYTDTDTALTGHVEVVPSGSGSTRELVYYVRPNGSDSKDGLTFITAKKTLLGAVNQAIADNGGSTVFPNGSQLTIYVDGTVNNATNSQRLGGEKLLTTEDGKHMLTVVDTYRHLATNATIHTNTKPINGGNASMQIATDLCFRNVNILSRANTVTNSETGKVSYFSTNKLYAAGCNLTLDNVKLMTDGNASGYTTWIVSSDHFARGGIDPLTGAAVDGTVTFKNGDYTNLNYVSTVNVSGIWTSEITHTEMPNITSKLIIEDGAMMGTVYGSVGAMQVGSSTIEVRGGSVKTLSVTASGTRNILCGTDVLISGGTVDVLNATGSGAKVNMAGDVNITMTGGTVNTWNGTGTEATVTGKITHTVTGGTVNKFIAMNTGAKATSVTNVFSGGTVGSYVGTASGTKDAPIAVTGDVSTTVDGATVNSYMGTGDYVTVDGNVTNALRSGTITGAQFAGLGNTVTLNKDLTNNISGGKLEILPTASGNSNHGIWFAGRDNITVGGDVTNNISGGEVSVHFTVQTTETKSGVTSDVGVQSGIWMGTRNIGVIKGDLTNNISGGKFSTSAVEGILLKSVTLYTGCYIGGIEGDLKNNISGGTFDLTGSYLLGGQGVNTYAHHIINVLGDQETGEGPVFQSAGNLQLGGGWGRVGVTPDANEQPDAATDCTDDVVLKTTIYGGTYNGSVFAGGSSAHNATKNQNTFFKGSVQTDIYGGSFISFHGSGKNPVYGKATTNIYGGTFNAIHGGRDGYVYDGIELNIYGMTEGSAPLGIWAGPTSGTVSTVTKDRDAVKLTIAPKDEMILSMPISAGCRYAGTVDGTTSVSVSGGTYANGFAVEGVTVKDALADGYCINNSVGLPVTLPDDALTTGEETVSVEAIVPVDASLVFSSASVTLQDDLSVNFKAPRSILALGGFSDPYAVFIYNGVRNVVSEYSLVGGCYVFTFSDIAPHRIGDSITAILYGTKDGVLYASKPIEYSVESYCYNMLGKCTEEQAELRTLLVDLLNYGAAAQQYVNYKTDDLVNAKLTDAQKAWGTQEDPAVDSEDFKLDHTVIENPTVSWVSGGLYLEDAVAIRLTLQAESIEGLTVQVKAAGAEYTYTAQELVPTGTENQYYLYFDKLNAAQMRELCLFTVYSGEQAVSNTVSYSVEAYLAAKWNDENTALADLVKAIIRYGDAAENYVK